MMGVHPTKQRTAVLVALLIAAASACGGDDDTDEGVATTATTADTAATTTAPEVPSGGESATFEGPCAVLTEAEVTEVLGLDVVAATPGDTGGTQTCSYELDADPEVFLIVFIENDVAPGQDLGAGLDEVQEVEVAGADAAVIGVQSRGTGADHIVSLVAGTMLTMSVGPIGTADADALIALAERGISGLASL